MQNRDRWEDERGQIQGADFCGKKSLLACAGKVKEYCVEFLKRCAAINSERFVQTLKQLKQRIRNVRPEGKMNQVLTFLTIPI